MDRTVICSLLERTPEAVERAFQQVPAGCGLIEVRGDHLEADDLAGLVRRAPRPVVVTVRRIEDGGGFAGSEEERRKRLRAALEAGARWVDVEWQSGLADLAQGEEADRAILSDHGTVCEARALHKLFDAMVASPARRLKIVPRATCVSETLVLRDLLYRARDGRLTAFASGPAGAASRVLALAWGGWGTYGAVAPGRETAEGQLTARELLQLYRATAIGATTRMFALFGAPVTESPSPAMHAAAYRALGLDAVYLPCPATELEEVERVCRGLGLAGFAVTVPLKERVATRVRAGDETLACGAVNTVRVERDGSWRGWSTDALAVEALVRRHLDPAGKRVAILGAGGMARAAAWAMKKAGARVVLYNRSAERARKAAGELGVEAAPWEAREAASWDILIQATPLGRGGERVLAAQALRGALVVEAVYALGGTPLVRAARERGLAVVDGFELLLAQAERQFAVLARREAPPDAMGEAVRLWLAQRALAFGGSGA